MQRNSWILKSMWEHLQAARSVVSFLCLPMRLQMQDLNLAFILWDLAQYPRVSFLKEWNFWFHFSPRVQRFPRRFQRPAKKRLLRRHAVYILQVMTFAQGSRWTSISLKKNLPGSSKNSHLSGDALATTWWCSCRPSWASSAVTPSDSINWCLTPLYFCTQ